MSNYTPGEEINSFICAHCNTKSFHVWSTLSILAPPHQYWPFDHLGNVTKTQGNQITDGHLVELGVNTWQVRTPWRASSCSACQSSTVWLDGSPVFPLFSPVPVPHQDMPESAASLYSEARDCYPHSRRAAAALARASLETLLRSRHESPGRLTLDGLLANLEGQVNASLWKVLTAIRVLGNDTLHDSPGELTVMYLSEDGADMTDAIFAAVNALVEELITQPRVADEMYALIPEGKRLDAEAKATRAKIR